MLLYAFVDRPHLHACRTSGIEHGVIPYLVVPRDRGRTKELKSWPVFQWLTSNQDFIDMTGTDGPPATAVLKGRKQEFRITVRVPSYGMGRLRRWTEFAKARQVPLRAEINKDIGAPEQWWIYAGVIPTAWFRGIARNPTAPDTTWDRVQERIAIPMNTTGGRGADKFDPANTSGSFRW